MDLLRMSSFESKSLSKKEIQRNGYQLLLSGICFQLAMPLFGLVIYLTGLPSIILMSMICPILFGTIGSFILGVFYIIFGKNYEEIKLSYRIGYLIIATPIVMIASVILMMIIGKFSCDIIMYVEK